MRTGTHVFRYRVVQSFLLSGTPFSRLPYFLPVLERMGNTLEDHSNLAATYIPKIEQHEMDTVKGEVSSNFVGVSFDGTTRIGEAVAITGRFCNKNFQLTHRLLRFCTTKLHLKAQGLSSLLTKVLCVDLAIPPENVVCFSRDSAMVNAAASRLLVDGAFTFTETQLCISHTLNNVGERIDFDVLDAFMTPWLELVGGSNPHRGAQVLWKATVAPMSVPGYSNVRWFCKAEIQFVLAANFDKIKPFLQQLDEHAYGDATRKKLHAIMEDESDCKKLELQLAAMLDMRNLISTTYALEGDGLELLLVYEFVERLRSLGSKLRTGGVGMLRNLDAVLRSKVTIKRGTKVEKLWPGFGMCRGVVMTSVMVDSTLYPGKERKGYTVEYESDGSREDLEEEELRPLLDVASLPERDEVVQGLLPAFDYLEARLQGDCHRQEYNYAHGYAVCKGSRLFDPTLAQQMAPSDVDELFGVVASLREHVSLEKMKAEMPAYLAAAKDVTFERDDVQAYTTNVLAFWRNASEVHIGEWKKAARIIFAFSPNSATCERVFSLMKKMYPEGRDCVLADHLQASLMMRYNKRVVEAPPNM